MIGTCNVCWKKEQLIEFSFTAYNPNNEPPLTIKQTFQICNTCFMEWWSGNIKLTYTKDEAKK